MPGNRFLDHENELYSKSSQNKMSQELPPASLEIKHASVARLPPAGAVTSRLLGCIRASVAAVSHFHTCLAHLVRQHLRLRREIDFKIQLPLGGSLFDFFEMSGHSGSSQQGLMILHTKERCKA